MVYGLNSNKLKDKVEGHQSSYWKTIEDCFTNIHPFGARYKRAKAYSRADIHASEVPVINEAKSTKELKLCFKCGGPHFQSRYMKKSYLNNKSPNYKKTDHSHKLWQNYHNGGQFPTATISFQVSMQVKPGDDISSTVNMIKFFFSKIGEKYSLQKKSLIVLQDLQRDLILGQNWQFNYKTGCNWNIIGPECMTHYNNYLCTSIPSTVTKPIV